MQRRHWQDSATSRVETHPPRTASTLLQHLFDTSVAAFALMVGLVAGAYWLHTSRIDRLGLLAVLVGLAFGLFDQLRGHKATLGAFLLGLLLALMLSDAATAMLPLLISQQAG